MMKRKKEKVAASLTVHRIGDMSAEGRRQIVAWLRKRAKEILDSPEAFGPVFRARYLYRPNTPNEVQR